MPNETDNGTQSMAQIVAEIGGDPSLLDSPPSEGLDPLPKEGEKPQRDDTGRFTKADDDVPGILKDAEKSEEGLPTDEEIEDLIKGLPKDEADRARRGVSKLVNRAKSYEENVKADAESLERFRSWEQALSNPETAGDALAQLTQQVQRLTGKAATTQVQQVQVSEAPDPSKYVDAEGECNWAAWAKDMASYSRASAKADVMAELGKEIQELKGFVSQSQAERQAQSKAESAVPQLQGLYGTELATPERVRSAVAKYPDLPVGDAFAATHVQAIARHFAEQGKKLSRGPKREMLDGQLTTRETQRTPGAFSTMDSILEEISIE
jgi:hypothetical protein